MALILIQTVTVASVAAYLYSWRAGLRRRNAQSWDSLVARLRLDWSARELSDICFSSNERTNTSPGQRLRRIRGANGLRAMFENTGVMMEMADYATRNSDSIDPELLAGLRRDALQIRLLIVKTIANYVFRTSQESVYICALRAESAYLEMELQMAELMHLSAKHAASEFVTST